MIRESVEKLLKELPSHVQLVGAAKTRTFKEIETAIQGGLQIIGENYLQEAEKAHELIGNKVKWHMIGHLQKNKVNRAVKIFDTIETVDSFRLASAIDRACAGIGKTMEILIEINSAEEPQKAGVMPENALSLIEEIAPLKNIRVTGLMTMGPVSDDPEESRPFFRRTKNLFDKFREMDIAGVEMKYLSMGMSDSYAVAIDEGANMVRIGTKIFGERSYS